MSGFRDGKTTSHLELDNIGTNTHADIDNFVGVTTTKGDLRTYSTQEIRLPVGIEGQVLTADPSGVNGIKWSTPAASGNVNDFTDPLDDNSLDANWTTDIPTVGTVTEQNNRLEIAHTGGTNLDWYGGVNFNAPGVYLKLYPADYAAKVFVDNITSTGDQHTAMITYLSGTPASFHRVELFYNGSYNVRVISGASVGGATAVGQDNLWLAIVRRGLTLYFLYSTAAKGSEPTLNDMTLISSTTQSYSYFNNLISLRSLTSAGNPAFENHLNNFSLLYP